MRTFALAATTLALLTAPALAEDGEPDYAPFPKLSGAVGVQGHGTRIGGRSEGGFGPTFEVAYGRGRWQYFVEGSLATSSLDRWTTSPTDTSIDGRMLRGNLGLRWIARQFQLSSHGGLELVLLSGVGAQHFNYDDKGDRAVLTRPEILVGFGMQVRSFRKPRLAFRLDLRAVFTPNDQESALVSCSGNCMDETGSSTGFLTGMALVW